MRKSIVILGMLFTCICFNSCEKPEMKDEYKEFKIYNVDPTEIERPGEQGEQC